MNGDLMDEHSAGDESQLDRPFPKISEPACHRQVKRQDKPYVLELAKGDARGEVGSTKSRGKRSGEDLCTDQAALSKRCRNSGSLARPNIDRLTNLSLWTWASTGPLL